MEIYDMDIKKLLLTLGFKPKNNTVDVYAKAYGIKFIFT